LVTEGPALVFAIVGSVVNSLDEVLTPTVNTMPAEAVRN